ncbi:unnamed protein product [Mytilus coruscus]|uniref:YqaJ viral recombinase domain-containing protein n=1 Tax=Mytilus coruscus TaxID=42192 RepID=A0A6J8AKT6_MYTCO|nr:unnamed protein product [Mytilus coruscus]
MWKSLLNSIITYDNYALDEERKIMLQDLTWSFFTNIRSDGSKFNTNAYMIPGTEPQSESEQWKSSRWFRVTASTAKQAHNLGFWVNKLWPELGCSPDGIVYDPNESNKYGLVEIKGPKLFKKIVPADVFKSLEQKIITNKDLYSACFSRPTSNDIKLELKTTHGYYFQIQFQLAITGLNWCDFVLWSNIGKPNIERI